MFIEYICANCLHLWNDEPHLHIPSCPECGSEIVNELDIDEFNEEPFQFF